MSQEVSIKGKKIPTEQTLLIDKFMVTLGIKADVDAQHCHNFVTREFGWDGEMRVDHLNVYKNW